MEEKNLMRRTNFMIVESLFCYYQSQYHLDNTAKLLSFGFLHNRSEQTYTIIFHTTIGDFIRLPYISDDDIVSSHDDGDNLYCDNILNVDFLCENVLIYRENTDPQHNYFSSSFSLDHYHIDKSCMKMFNSTSFPMFPRSTPIVCS